MKALLRVITICLCSQELITLDLELQYRITERHNLRIRMDGSYKDYLYKEYRGFFRQKTDNREFYHGEFYILQNMKRNSQLIVDVI